ncbi:MAG: YicC/YloC family endoribonuclease [Bacteroidota bacterium]
MDMIKSMTGFSKSEAKENGTIASVEIKSLNGRYLETNIRMPRHLTHKELEVKDLIRKSVERGTISVYINIDYDETERPFILNETAAESCYTKLNELKKRLKIREAVKMDHVLHFSQSFTKSESEEDESLQLNLIKRAVRNALRSLDNMKQKEGRQISKDILSRMNKIKSMTDQIEEASAERVPQERERLRQRIAQLFESDEIDEYRIQMEMVIQADKLDVSEECVRLNSHIKFFFDTFNKAKEPIGRKINFLLQEMHREINTIGSKISDANISQMVVNVKEELEKIREQVQNLE